MSGYIGTQPVPQATQTRETFTATASQTSFATGGYQAGYIDVFLNGVKLVDGTDYTATNGSDVVLTTGAASGDTLEVVAYTAFEAANVTGATDFTVTGSFTSRGIDDNASATAMTLDSSGNLLVGKTTPALATAGTAIRGDNAGLINSARAGTILELNRLSTDGSIVDFFKNGSTVGSIGTGLSSLSVGTGNTQLMFWNAQGGIFPSNGTTVTDNSIDFGNPNYRFKDLYLSGGVYLGGTGSANKLDDYEEGTWTPSLNAGTASFGNNTYVKVGRQVIATLFVTNFSDTTSSTGLTFNGLPYASDGDYIQGSVSLYRYVVTGNGGHHVAIYGGGSSTNCTLYTCRPNTSNYEQITHNDLTSSSASFFLKIIYTTNS